jgi:hypothetical protein
VKLPRRIVPISRARLPGWSWSATQGWLNQTALIEPVSSETVASTIVSRPRARRFEMRSTSTSIATSSSSPNRLEISRAPTCRNGAL